MSPEAEAIKKVIEQLQPELLWLLFQTSVIGIITIVFYNMYTTVAAYISFRSNHDLGKNVKIMINNREGFITHYTIRFIHIRLQDTHNEMIIPMKNWEKHDWIIVKNGNR